MKLSLVLQSARKGSGRAERDTGEEFCYGTRSGITGEAAVPPWLVWSKTVTLRLEGPEGAGRRTGGECTVERGVHCRMAWGRAGPRRVRAMRPVWGGLAGGQWGSRARREGAGQSGPCQARAFALGVRSGPAGAEAAGIVFWRSLLLASRHVGAWAGLSRAAP